ncbi:MAG: DNA polymerase, partial [Anaerolineales bacterium]|nr:DNA polymerase [Anaerolineales bacterium]
MPPILYLIDGHALAYRTYFALTRGSSGGFTTRSGEPTAGVFGFTSVLLRLLEQEKPEYLAVAFDTGKTFRDELYSEYKATREKMPDDLRLQIERIRQIVDAFNIPRLEVEGYEADDVLGSVAHLAVQRGFGVKIITGDRDLLQLVDERIIVNLPGKSLSDAKDYFAEDVISYLGVRPEQVVDYKALVGDKSDNIPGVLGVGEKTAIILINTYGSLDEVYRHLADLPDGTRKKLEAGREQAYLSQKLARIVTDLNIALDLDQARVSQFDPAAVEAIFRELEFRLLLTRLVEVEKLYGVGKPRGEQQLSLFAQEEKTPAMTISTPVALAVQVVDTSEKLGALVDSLAKATTIAFDTETTSTDQMRGEMVGISLATGADQAYYLPVGHQPGFGLQLPLDQVLEALRAPLIAAGIRKVGHNLKYDFIMLARHGLRVFPLSFDTMIAEWLSNPSSRNLGLKNLAWVRLDYRMTPIDELIGKGKKQISMAEVPIDQAAAYAGADAAVIFRLMPELEAELNKAGAMRLFDDLEMPLVSVLADMEMAGVLLDTAYLAEMSAELSERLQAIETQIYQAAGMQFNLNSPQQLSDVLFKQLKIASPDRAQRTASGFFSTAAGVLESLRGKHPVIDLVLEYRELS